MKFLRRLIAASLLALCPFAARAQFGNIQTNATFQGATNNLASGATWTWTSGSTVKLGGASTNTIWYTNGSGNLASLGLGAGMSISGGNLVAGSSTSANPTAVVGATAVNGSASTFMRSDAAPAIDLTFTPTWTGLHTWGPTLVKTAGTDYVIELTPTLNQRNATNATVLYIDEYITQAGSGHQYYEEYATGGGSPTDTWTLDTGGHVTAGIWQGTAVGSVYGGTGLSSFTQGSLLYASSANTWAALADGTANYLLQAGGAGVVPSYQPVSGVLDTLGSAAQGDVLYRNATTWVYLTPGTSGQVLSTQGAAANPQWATVITAPGTTTTHDAASYSNATGNLEDLGILSFPSGTSANFSAITAVQASDASGNGVFRAVDTSTSTSNYYVGSFLSNAMGTGAENILAVGFATSTNNAAYLGFHYAGNGSASNYLSLGFSGNADLVELNPAGLLTTKAHTATGAVIMNAGTASSSYTTGTAVITGGVGISGKIFTNDNITGGGSITTAAGSTAAAGAWNLGALRSSTALVASTTTVIQIAVGGTLYSLMTCTTNP